MTEVSLNHELKSLCCTGGVARDHGTAGHDMTDVRCVRIKTLCSDLLEVIDATEGYARKTDILCMPSPWR